LAERLEIDLLRDPQLIELQHHIPSLLEVVGAQQMDAQSFEREKLDDPIQAIRHVFGVFCGNGKILQKLMLPWVFFMGRSDDERPEPKKSHNRAADTESPYESVDATRVEFGRRAMRRTQNSTLRTLGNTARNVGCDRIDAYLKLQLSSNDGLQKFICGERFAFKLERLRNSNNEATLTRHDVRKASPSSLCKKGNFHPTFVACVKPCKQKL
jgi:hypothetical protein